MSWFGEVWHQLRRDVSRMRWLLLVYLVVLALAVASAVPSTGELSRTLAPVGQVVLLCVPVVMAMTVHADSPMRVDAFWAVLPIRASVIVASKLLYGVLLVGLWSVAVGVVMSQWQLLSAVSVADIGLHDVVATLVLLMLGTALVTAGCASLAGVGVVLGAALALSMIIVFSGNGLTWGFTAREWWSVAVPLAVCGVVLLAQRYRVRSTSQLSRSVSMAAGVAVVLFPTLTLDARVSDLQTATAPGTTSAVVLRVPLRGQPECAPTRLKLPLEVRSPWTWRVELMRPRLDVLLDDGSHVELSRESWMQAAGLMGPMLPPASAQVVGDSAATRVFSTEIWFDLPSGSSTRVCGHIASVSLRMPTHVAVPREVLRVPLTSAAPMTAAGHRIRVVAADVSDTTVAIRMEMSMLTSATDRGGVALGEMDFALVEPGRPRVVRLAGNENAATVRLTMDGDADRTAPATDQWAHGGLQRDVNALPGLMVVSRRLQLSVNRDDAERARDLRSWSDRAVLLAIAPDWHPYEMRTVRSTVPAPSTTRPAAGGR